MSDRDPHAQRAGQRTKRIVVIRVRDDAGEGDPGRDRESSKDQLRRRPAGRATPCRCPMPDSLGTGASDSLVLAKNGGREAARHAPSCADAGEVGAVPTIPPCSSYEPKWDGFIH